jgi:hypothetical protein
VRTILLAAVAYLALEQRQVGQAHLPEVQPGARPAHWLPAPLRPARTILILPAALAYLALGQRQVG